MKFKNLLEALDRVKDRKIGVIGDLSLDIYWYADMKLSELSLETPNFPLPITKEKFSLGAAGNIVNNLSVLGVKEIDFITVIGEDWRRDIALDLLNKLGNVNTDYIIATEDRVTPAYCKPIKYGISDVVYEDSRLDFWNTNEIDKNTENQMIEGLNLMAEKVDIIVVEEQLNNSIITNEIRKTLAELGGRGKTIIVDSRINPHKYSNCIIKPNEHELEYMGKKLGFNISHFGKTDLAKKISKRLNNELIVTLGDKGSMWVYKDDVIRKDVFEVDGPVDIVGAGDGFISGLASFFNIVSREEALLVGNLISSIVIQKIGITGSANREEIIKAFVSQDPDPFFQKYRETDTFNIKAAIFDFDGTISTLRHGWEDVMFDYVFEQLSPYYKDKRAIERKIWDFIDDTTGVQTIHQMQWIVEEVKSCGGEALDKWEYKDGYNDALIKVVNKRTKQLLDGSLEQSDFRIPGSKEFIEQLVGKGIKCYIASGTDDVDIKKEMKSIGVDHLFEDSMGAPYRKVDCPKASVYNRLINELDYKPNEIMIVGDGKVEINLGKENGSLTLGVACDEHKLEGIDVNKLDRLMKAEADGIVIDFCDYTSLLEWMEEETYG